MSIPGLPPSIGIACTKGRVTKWRVVCHDCKLSEPVNSRKEARQAAVRHASTMHNWSPL